MKKFTTIFLLLLVLTVSAFADGETPGGNRNCTPPTQCVVEEPVEPTSEPTEDNDSDIGVILGDIWKALFGE